MKNFVDINIILCNKLDKLFRKVGREFVEELIRLFEDIDDDFKLVVKFFLVWNFDVFDDVVIERVILVQVLESYEK